MSKRQVTHQQTNRIRKKQTRFQEQASSTTSDKLSTGLVIQRYSRHALLEETNGRQRRCTIRPDIETLVAGDEVVWLPEGEEQGVVVAVSPRKSVLNRPDFRGTLKPVAANITQVMIVVAPMPEISWALLDSYLVMTETLRLMACIVLNKTDLDKGIESKSLVEQLRTIYAPLNYPILAISREHQTGHAALMAALNHQTSVFVGQSGVGKSSIISRILPDEMHIRTSEVSEHSNLGCHTTRNSCLYHLANGGHLIDSPGVREFSLWDLPNRHLAEGFREFKPLITQCQFRNCNHQNTPGCAVIQALNEGQISPLRYENYVKLATKKS
jgi:ribosome biogenesis GTPase